MESLILRFFLLTAIDVMWRTKGTAIHRIFYSSSSSSSISRAHRPVANRIPENGENWIVWWVTDCFVFRHIIFALTKNEHLKFWIQHLKSIKYPNVSERSASTKEEQGVKSVALRRHIVGTSCLQNPFRMYDWNVRKNAWGSLRNIEKRFANIWTWSNTSISRSKYFVRVLAGQITFEAGLVNRHRKMMIEGTS